MATDRDLHDAAHGAWFGWKQKVGGYPKAQSAFLAAFRMGAEFQATGKWRTVSDREVAPEEG